jgi:expansin (peptidoglycan-binding protein)
VLRPLLPAAVIAGLLLLLVPACGGDDLPSDGSSGSGGATILLSSEQTQGIATFYDYSGSGAVACSYDIGSNTDVAAIDTAEFASAAACGSCLDVSGPKGKITVKIVDLCPPCQKNHLDLSAQAFAKIADPAAGRISITYQLVACNVKGNMSYHFKDGSSKYWTAIQILDHRVPVAKVEYEKNGVYTEMPRADYNYFVAEQGVGDQPNGIALRITASNGESVEDKVPNVQENKTFAGSVQFK